MNGFPVSKFKTRSRSNADAGLGLSVFFVFLFSSVSEGNVSAFFQFLGAWGGEGGPNGGSRLVIFL